MSRKNETDLNKYKREGKVLKPPLSQLPMSTVSWIHGRLPNMLWGALVMNSSGRNEALEFYRHCLSFVDKKKDLPDITLEGIAAFPFEEPENFIKHVVAYPKLEIKKILSPMLLIESLPAKEVWTKNLNSITDIPQAWKDLADSIGVAFWHQSQEATDLRWLKLSALVLTGKFQMPADSIDEIINYPNKGDMRSVRPMIRASEIAIGSIDGKPETFPPLFWKECFDKTMCIPSSSIPPGLEGRYREFETELKHTRPFYFDTTKNLRHDLVTHCLTTSVTSAIDAKHEAVFGLALYGLGNFIENNFYRSGVSVNARSMLRTLLETYLTLAYLAEKSKTEPTIWDEYRMYGNGQANLVYRKFEENNFQTSSLKPEDIEAIANEDKWVEFVPINLGHWDNLDLRKIAEIVGEKPLYDKFFTYTSGFVHANWAAVRESQYQKCLNPLHRLHRIPSFDLPVMGSATNDMVEIVNKILLTVDELYPDFKGRLDFAPANKDITDNEEDEESETKDETSSKPDQTGDIAAEENTNGEA